MYTQAQAGDTKQHVKLADDKKELQQTADKQQNAEVAEDLKAPKHQATLEQMPNTEGAPGPPKRAPDAGPKSGQTASQSKSADVRKVDNPEVHLAICNLSCILVSSP